MNRTESQQKGALFPNITEDWWSVVVGIGLALLVYAGFIGYVPW